MDAYDVAEKLKKYWAALYPKNSGELAKTKAQIHVIVNTPDGFKAVKSVVIQGDHIELILED
jgi:hypothetical protein